MDLCNLEYYTVHKYIFFIHDNSQLVHLIMLLLFVMKWILNVCLIDLYIIYTLLVQSD